MKKPRVSIGMPVYNAGRYLRAAIDALLGQTLGDLEIVLCDNASTDDTADICRQYAGRDSRIHYYRNETNLGCVANFNIAFERSSGRYFKWASYDDVHEPTYLEKCLAVLEREPGIAVAHCLTRRIDDQGRDCGEFPVTHRLDAAQAPERFRRMLWTDAFPPIWGLMRAAQIRRTGLMGAYMGSDRNFLAEMLLMGNAAYVPEFLFLLREHAGSYTSSVKEYYKRLSWFAPRARIPSWMQVPATFAGYAGSLYRAQMPWPLKVACFRHLMEWAGTCARQLLARRLGPLVSTIGGAIATPPAVGRISTKPHSHREQTAA